MLTIILSGLVLGFGGSFHCLAMCGAISLSVKSAKPGIAWSQLLYHLGRILSYCVLAVVLSASKGLNWLQNGQNIISISLGSALFVGAILFIISDTLSQRASQAASSLLYRLRKLIFPNGMQSSLWNAVAIGLINGLLPCGFVYLALAGSLMQDSVPESLLFMSAFGLGTIPALAGLSLAAKIPVLSNVISSRRFVVSAAALAGLLLVVRGMALGIPYLSPALPSQLQTMQELRHENVCGSPQGK